MNSRLLVIVVLIDVAVGVVLAAVDAPTWSYPVVLIAFVAAVLAYQRRQHGRDEWP